MTRYKSKKETKSKTFKPLISREEETYDFFLKHCSQPSFQDDKWFKNDRECNLIESRKRSDYLPFHSKSAHFKVTNNGDYDVIDDIEWIQLENFKTHINPESDTLTGYIGSECYAMEWLPIPIINGHEDKESVSGSDENDGDFQDYSQEKDFIIVASVGDGRGFDDYEKPNYIEKTGVHRQRRGLFQLWKLEANQLECACCFTNDYGLVWSIEASKAGTSYCPSRGRLSLIAVAFDNGYVRLFSIPLLENLVSSQIHVSHRDNNATNNDNHNLHQSPSIFNLPPVAVLEPPYTSHIVCRCLSWSWCDEQKYLTCGYGNGVVNYYNLLTSSSLLVNYNQQSKYLSLKPVKTWIAHGALVSAIQILPIPGSKIIITGGWDRNIKLWNVTEARLLPLLILHRSLVHCLISSIHWQTGFFLSLDECFLASNQSIVTFKQLCEEGQRSLTDNRSLYTLPCETSNVYSLSLSIFFNSLLVSDNSGNSLLQNNFRAKHEKSTRRKLSDLLPVFTSQLRCLVSKNADDTNEKDTVDDNDGNAGANESGTVSTESSTLKKGGVKVTTVNSTKGVTDKVTTGPTTSSNGYMIDKNKPRERNYEEMTAQYGIIFNDFTLNKMDSRLVPVVSEFRENPHLKRSRLTDYPLTSINKCIWSPNKGTCNFLANLIHSGFLRISRISDSFIQESATNKK